MRRQAKGTACLFMPWASDVAVPGKPTAQCQCRGYRLETEKEASICSVPSRACWC